MLRTPSSECGSACGPTQSVTDLAGLAIDEKADPIVLVGELINELLL
jgi:hypothetical protein